MGNIMIGKRRKGVHYEYDGDGRFPQERWSESDKRYWTRWLRRIGKEEVEEIKEDLNLKSGSNIVPVLFSPT